METTLPVNEYWVPVIDTNGCYEVSHLGRFRAAKDIVYTANSRWARKGDIKYHEGEIIPQYKGEYLTVCLYLPGVPSKQNKFSTIQSHILVSVSFQGHWDNLTTDHDDANKWNNQIGNLNRMTNQANNQKTYTNDEHGRWTRRKSAVVRSDGMVFKSIKAAVAGTDGPISDAALISAIQTGGVSAGYHWRYADDDKQKLRDDARPLKRYNTRKRATNTSYLVRCVEYDEIKKCSEWAKQLGCVTDTIYRAIDYCGGYSKYLNKHFELV